jgi:hypothetical protein
MNHPEFNVKGTQTGRFSYRPTRSSMNLPVQGPGEVRKVMNFAIQSSPDRRAELVIIDALDDSDLSLEEFERSFMATLKQNEAERQERIVYDRKKRLAFAALYGGQGLGMHEALKERLADIEHPPTEDEG